MRTYTEMLEFDTFVDRFNYLKLDGVVGSETFGSTRFVNQDFYRSPEWKRVRAKVIVRDLGRDLAIENREVFGRILVHHIEPITERMVYRNSPLLLSPDNLVCCSPNTHRAIHFGDENLLEKSPIVVERRPGDTKLW